jgi:hypothetical protein
MDEASNRHAINLDEANKMDKHIKRAWKRREAANVRVGTGQDEAKSSPAGQEEVGNASNKDKAISSQASNLEDASKIDKTNKQ